MQYSFWQCVARLDFVFGGSMIFLGEKGGCPDFILASFNVCHMFGFDAEADAGSAVFFI
jgi:hypothetical protein